MCSYFHLKSISKELLDRERRSTLFRLLNIVPEACIFEVGSTAVDGVIGKQDLDFLVRVATTEFLPARTALDQIFSRNPEQLSNGKFQGYHVESELDVAVQLTIEGGPYDHFLTFLTALKSNADLRQKYNALKMKYDGALMSDYREAKHQFIERVLSTTGKGD